MKHLLKSLATIFVALLTLASCQSNADFEFGLMSLNENVVSNTITRSVQNDSESYWELLMLTEN